MPGWREDVEATAVKQLRTDTYRAAFHKDIRETIDRIDLPEKEKLKLYRAFGYPKRPTDDDLAHELVELVFNRPRAFEREDRFSKGFNALYSSFFRNVCEHELAYHARQRLKKRGESSGFATIHIIAIVFHGSVCDISEMMSSNMEYYEDLAICWKVGAFMKNRTQGLIVRSFREIGNNKVVYDFSSVIDCKYIGKTCIRSWYDKEKQKYVSDIQRII